ncbi:alpha-L-fucosidase [bacterium]
MEFLKRNMWKVYIVCLVFIVGSLSAQSDYRPTEANVAAREWFQDAKFGLFVHWGVYSVLGDGEWVMQVKKMDLSAYEKLPPCFNPIDFNPAEWVAMVKAAGMKYITITSKHHDGFCMFDSKLTEWDIVDRTPYQKDIIRKLAKECHKQGVKLFLYYSQLDWYHSDYFPRGWTGRNTGRPESGDWDKYLKTMNGQLSELLTQYGDIGGIWFDGWWDRKDANWKLDETYSLIHALQPACLIGSNHHQSPNSGEDFQMFEKDLPGKNTSGFSAESKIGALPLETCETMNNSWGFNITDTNYKSTREIIQYLVKAAGNNANFLLNVGPMSNGKIQPEFVDSLKVVGQWLETFGETIYGTRGGPVSQHEWGVTTYKKGTIFVHVINRMDDFIFLPDFTKKIKSVGLFHNKMEVNYSANAYGVVLKLPDALHDMVDLVIEIKCL